MEKEDKISKRIKGISNHGSQVNLHSKKNDECYTSMQDIMNELSYWADLGKFQGKNIICPCDWDIVDGEEIYGITITYNEDAIEVIGNNVYKAVKSVQYDLWSDADTTDNRKTVTLTESTIEDFLRNKLTCNFVRTLAQNARKWGIKSITASGYNPANNKGTPFQDIDYSQYDICITNPPFSLYDKFMKTIVGNIDFIVLAPYMNRVNPCVGLYLMNNKAFLGNSGNTNYGYILMQFQNPTEEDKTHTKRVACDWITSYDDAQKERNIKFANHTSGFDYDTYKDDYTVLTGMTMKDGSHPIKVLATQIPDNYGGWMFAAPSVIAYLNYNEYEWYGTNFMKYYNTTNPAANPFNHRTSNEMIKDATGKQGFHGIVFRKKQVNKENN